MLAEWGAGHRLAGPCDSVKLQPHLPPKPAGGETTSPKGTASRPPLCLSVCLLPFFLPVSLFSFYLPLSSVLVLSACNRMVGQTLFSRMLIFYCVSVYVCIGWD